MIPGFWGFYKQGGALQGYPFAGNVYYTGTNKPVFGKRTGTIQNAIDLMIARDVLFIGPGSHDEAVVIPAGLADITIIGAGNRGDVGIAPSTTNASALTMTGTSGSSGRVQGVTLVNVGLEGNGTGGGLHVKGNIRRLRAYGCKCEGGAFGVKLESDANGSVADTILEDLELCWTDRGLLIAVSGGGDPVTQTRFKDSLLHNCAVDGLLVDTVQSADLWVHNNKFARLEDGSEPSNSYLSAAVVSTTGQMANNAFACAAASGKIAVAANFIKSGNSYSDGWAA